MSFILDALKKSESERQRQAIPGLMDASPTPRRPRLPLWGVALGALFAINLVVLIVVLTRGSSAPTTPPTVAAPARGAAPASAPATSAPASTSPSAGPGPTTPAGATAAFAPPKNSAGALTAPATQADHFSPMDGAGAYAPEVPPAGEAPSEVAPHAGSAGAPARARPSHQPSAEASPLNRPADPVLTHPEAADAEVLPSINEINLNGQLPEMHIDVHVYATNPADRFVYINMRRYREGETLAEGPVLEHIRRDGAVLAFRGVRFLLPRQP